MTCSYWPNLDRIIEYKQSINNKFQLTDVETSSLEIVLRNNDPLKRAEICQHFGSIKPTDPTMNLDNIITLPPNIRRRCQLNEINFCKHCFQTQDKLLHVAKYSKNSGIATVAATVWQHC